MCADHCQARVRGLRTANLYDAMVGPDAEGRNRVLYFVFKTGKGFFVSQVDPDG